MQISEELVRELIDGYEGLDALENADLLRRAEAALAAPSPMHISELYEAAKQIDPQTLSVSENRIKGEDYAIAEYRSTHIGRDDCLGDSAEALLADIRESLAEMVSSR